MSDAIEKLKEDHRNMTALLGLIRREAKAFADGERLDFRLLEGILDYTAHFPECMHHPLEDEIFRKLKERAPEEAEEMADLAAEHKQLAERRQRLSDAVQRVLSEQEMSRETFAEIAADYCDSFETHVEMEEASLFPVAAQELTAADWAEIEENAESGSDPLFGGEGEQEYERIRKAIISWEI